MRKEIEITIEEGRDAGKTFKIVEMPASQMDRWATRAICLFGKSGNGIAVLANMDTGNLLEMLSKIDYEKAEPLLNELLECASFKKDGVYVAMKGALVDSVVEDWTTIFRLRMEALHLSLDFLEEEKGSKSG